MRDRGLLAGIEAAGERGIDAASLAGQVGLSLYGTRVLLDFGLDIGLVEQADGNFTLAKTGYFVLNDDMTRVNMEFTRDVCYQTLGVLDQSIQDGKPRGLAVLGDWEILYDGLTVLPGTASQSWCRFDHYCSDRVFEQFLAVVLASPARYLLDIGGNGGRWALCCLAHDPALEVTVMNLPQQLAIARRDIDAAGYGERFHEYLIDVLREDRGYFDGADVIWMSQFLDCSAEHEILKILRHVVAVMDEGTVLYIIELFWDRQRYDAARFSLNATSLYFTCVANGNSRMYHSADMIALAQQAGLVVDQDTDGIGEGHTVLRCRLAGSG